jgi:hypothetical protein
MTLLRTAAAVLMLAVVGVAADPAPVVVKFDKLSAPVPANWQSVRPANRLRSHQFKLPSGNKAVAGAEVYVMPDSNPDPAKSFPKWKASFVPPEGKTIDAVAKVSKFTVNGVTVHQLDVTGTWKYKPFPMARKEELRPDYRAVWAIVATKDGATHVRLSGPAPVVAKYYPAFEAWLKSMK